MIHISKNRHSLKIDFAPKNHLCGPHLVLVITFQLGSGKMFQDASFTVSSCHLQHSLSTRKDCLCMRHATPCICPTTFTSAMQLHASALQLLWNWIGSKKINQSDASIIKVFDLCWYQLHMSSGTTALLNSCTHALLHLLSTLIRAPVSDTVTLICLHQSNWSCYCCAVGTS